MEQFCQTTNEQAFEETKAFLNKRIEFEYFDSSLPDILHDLASKHAVNIVFSSSLIGKDEVVKAAKYNEPLFKVLDHLLYGKSLDYRALGTTIVIFENPSKKIVAVDSLPFQKKKYDPVAKHLEDSIFVINHVFSYNPLDFNHIPKKDRRRVQRAFEAELSKYSLGIKYQRDTVVLEKLKLRYPALYLGFYLGLPKCNIHRSSKVSYDWESELSLRQEVVNKIGGGLYLKFIHRYFSIKASVGGCTWKVQNTWVEMKKNGAQVELPDKSNAAKLNYLISNDQFTVLKIPIALGYECRLKRHRFNPNFGFVTLVKSAYKIGDQSQFKDYYTVKEPNSAYYQTYGSRLLGLCIGLDYNYKLWRNYYIGTEIRYETFRSMLVNNPIFGTKLNSTDIYITFSKNI